MQFCMELDTSVASIMSSKQLLGGGDGGSTDASGPSKLLLTHIRPICKGSLKRRTRFTRGWRGDADYLEIRGHLLLLFKSKKGNAIGFLDSIFHQQGSAGGGSTATSSGVASPGGAKEAPAEAAGGAEDISYHQPEGKGVAGGAAWDSQFDLTGAIVSSMPHSEKDKTYPFKIVMAKAGDQAASKDSEARTLHLCASSDEERSEWIQGCETAARAVDRTHFDLLYLIGRGQWGKVFLARKSKGVVAGSTTNADEGGETEILALKEVQLTAKTNLLHSQNERLVMELVPPHPFLVGMQYAFRSGRFLYYALDFCNGGDLFRHWRRHRDRRNEMAPFYVAEVMLALEHLHKHSVLYRDLKPENVLLDGVGHIKLADLGLAKRLVNRSDRTSSFCGTEAYLAPEMIMRLPYGVSVDFWQYGCLVFELYAGRSPFWLPRKPRKFIRENILNGAFAFPSVIPEAAKGLISGLLQVGEAQRLGCGQDGQAEWNRVKEDSFFAEMDWEALVARTLTPPVVPESPGPDLINNFDEDFTNQPAEFGTDEEDGGWPVYYEQELQGFGYVRRPTPA